MCRNKKKWFVLATVALTFTISACSNADKLITDTGSSGQKKIGKEEYLNVDALNQDVEQIAKKNYTVILLEKGVFEEKALNQTLNRAYINIPVVELEMQEGTVRVDEYVAGNMFQHVEKGDVIMTVQPEIDKITLEEAKIKLTRLTERLQKAAVDYEEALAEAKVDKRILQEGYVYGTYEKNIINLQCNQMTLDWEKTKHDFEVQIEAVKEQIADMEASRNTTEVTAPVSGNIIFETKYPSGLEIGDGEYICHIITSDIFYVQTKNQADEFGYGMALSFRNMDEVVEGTVISGGNRMLYGNLDSDEATFSITFEDNALTTNRMQMNSIVMEGNLKTVENVIMVPKKAVTEEDGDYFVTVLKEDGSLLKTEFIPGGDNPECYWVYEGLEEGMQIVY